MSLTRFDSDGIELIIDTATGESFASISGYARMSGRAKSTIHERAAKLVEFGKIKEAEIDTGYGSKTVALIPLPVCKDMLLYDYHKNPSQQIFNTLKGIYERLGIPVEGLVSLHAFNKGNKNKLKGSDREKQIQLAYQTRYGGEIEVDTKYGRIDLLTDDRIYEFKSFSRYKEALGQLLSYSRCVPQPNMSVVLFGTPKKFKNFNIGFCKEIKELFTDYGITVKFLR